MVIHVVKKGDSLYAIGREYGVNYLQIAKDNEVPLDATLVIGQTLVINTGKSEKRGMIEVNGFAFPNMTDDILAKTLPYLTYLSIFSCEVTAAGQLKHIDDQKCVAACKKWHVLPVLVITNIDGEKGFSSNIARAIITDENVQMNLIENILNRLKENGYAGIDVDFENIYAEDKEGFNEFMAKMTDTLHNHGYCVSSQLTPRTKDKRSAQLYEAHDYAAHGATVDYVTLMGYERGGGHKAPAAVASMPELKVGLDYAMSQMGSEMILMGIPNYGYDWKLPYGSGEAAKTVGNYQAVSLARHYGAQIEYDKQAMAPFFNYYDESSTPHHVWFEDARSIRAKLNVPFHHNLGGISYWTVNWYFPQNWLVLSGLYDVVKG